LRACAEKEMRRRECSRARRAHRFEAARCNEGDEEEREAEA
jgi:hypothetical protein